MLNTRQTLVITKCLYNISVYRKSEKVYSPTKTGNVSFAKPHPKYEYDKIQGCLSRQISRFDPRSLHDS